MHADSARLEAALAPFAKTGASGGVVRGEWVADPENPTESLVRLAQTRSVGGQGAA
ncbi:hypothetical protein [Cupriavidus sp. 8B]